MNLFCSLSASGASKKGFRCGKELPVAEMGSVRESTDAMADAAAAPELGVDNAVGVPAPARPLPNQMPGTPPGPPPATPPKGESSDILIIQCRFST